jgi:hypothetical protein
LRPERVPRGMGRLALAGQARGERVTAAGCGRLSGLDAVISLMRGDLLVRRAYLDGRADLS